MNRIVTQDEKERLLALLDCLPDEPDTLFRQSIRQVIALLAIFQIRHVGRRQPFPLIGMEIRPRQAMLGRCHLPIEPMLFGHSNLFGTNMPFANISGPIACLLKGLAYRGLANRNMSSRTVSAAWFARIEPTGETNALGILACHQGSASR